VKLPLYMEPGSTGSYVTAVQIFLVGQGFGKDIRFDRVQGPTTVLRIKDWQRTYRLKPDGGIGPETRAKMKHLGFDFDAVGEGLGGNSVFVQPDGKEVEVCHTPLGGMP
jgi:peptidoglycan hydrolase-like protein with peptidoglycan-binding domain